MALYAVKFTERSLPMILKAYPFVKDRWTEEILNEYLAEDNYFVIDTEFKQLWRILTVEHFEDVYEMSVDEIGDQFTEI